jgi:anti-sigma28 factor (negative regulator of flagellin synthesis)
VDQARIAQLQQAIAAGTFEAHSQQILQSVVALETQLYG